MSSVGATSPVPTKTRITTENAQCDTCQWFGGATVIGGGVYAIWTRKTIKGKYGPQMGLILGIGLIGAGFYTGFVDTYLNKWRGWPPLL